MGGTIRLERRVLIAALALASAAPSFATGGNTGAADAGEVVGFVHLVDGRVADERSDGERDLEPGDPVYAGSRLVQRSDGIALVLIRTRRGPRRISSFPFAFDATDRPEPIPERLHEHYLAQIGGTAVRGIPADALPDDVLPVGIASLLIGSDSGTSPPPATVFSSSGPRAFELAFAATADGLGGMPGFVVPGIAGLAVESSPESLAGSIGVRTDATEGGESDRFVLSLDLAPLAGRRFQIVLAPERPGASGAIPLNLEVYDPARDAVVDAMVEREFSGDETPYERRIVTASVLRRLGLEFQAALVVAGSDAAE